MRHASHTQESHTMLLPPLGGSEGDIHDLEHISSITVRVFAEIVELYLNAAEPT